MVSRLVGRVVLGAGLLAVGSCVSPVELPTEREVVPRKRSIELTVEETVELNAELRQMPEGEEFRWLGYAAEVDEAVLDTAAGLETLRLRLRIVSTEPPPQRRLWLDTAELVLDGLRGGEESEDLAAVRSLRLTLWEANNGVVARRMWHWQRGQPPLPNARLRCALVRSRAGSRPRWLLSIRLILVRPEPQRERFLRLSCVLRLAPA